MRVADNEQVKAMADQTSEPHKLVLERNAQRRASMDGAAVSRTRGVLPGANGPDGQEPSVHQLGLWNDVTVPDLPVDGTAPNRTAATSSLAAFSSTQINAEEDDDDVEPLSD